VFTPELIIELRLKSSGKSSKITIETPEDTMDILDGIKDLLDEHLVLVYLDDNKVVEGIDAFLTNLKSLDKERPNRTFVRTLVNQTTSKEISSVIIIQTVPVVDKPDIKSVDMTNLASLAGKMLVFEIDVFDCILMGSNGYFSFKQNMEAWVRFEEAINKKREYWDAV